MLEKDIRKDIHHGWEYFHNIISTTHKKCRGRAPRGCTKVINKLERGTLYQKTQDPWMLIPRPLRSFGKQPSPTEITPTMLLWILPDQDSTYDLSNAKQMANIKEYLLERQTWTQPKAGYMKTQQPRRHAFQ